MKKDVEKTFRKLAASPRGLSFSVTRYAMLEGQLTKEWLQSQCKRFGVFGEMDDRTDNFIVTNIPPSAKNITKVFGYRD